MNKFGMVLGMAAVAVIAGCKDPDYKYANSSQNEVKPVDAAGPAVIPAGQMEPSAKPGHCTCPPGARHDGPCMCGAPDCRCVSAQPRPVIVANPSQPQVKPAAAAAEPETTVYIVQSGDYLAKISKKFNVTISSIKKLNPSIKENNVVRVGQKIKLPGKIDVGVQSEPVRARAAKKAYAPYTGATKEYVVKNGDTLGAIAYSNGINIRQLKELNGLSGDMLRIGQKLKIPAAKVVAAKAAPAAAKPKAVAKKPEATGAAVASEKPAESAAATAAESAEPAAAEQPAAATAVEQPAEPASAADASAFTTYVVQEGDDMTGVSIRWGVSAAVIRELNNLGDKDQLVPGQIIKLPADAQQ